jgi:hypothetical protein
MILDFLLIHFYFPTSFFMNVKLFAIMGGFWIMESISWFVSDETHVAFWMPFDMLNALRGLWLLIFCVFLSKRVRTALIIKCLCMSGIKTPSASIKNTATVSMTKCSQSDHTDQVEMNVLVADENRANDTPPRCEDTI